MKSFLPTLVFALVTATLVTFAYFEFQKGKEQEITEEIKNRIFPDLNNKRLNQVIFHNGSQTIKFQVQEGNWKIHQPQMDEGNDNEINHFLLQLLRQDVYFVQMKSPINWAEYGLDKPLGYVHLTTQTGEEYKVDISGDPTFDGRHYLRKQNQLLIGHRQWGGFMKMTFEHFKHQPIPQGKEPSHAN